MEKTTTDVGLDALARIHSRLMIDEPWTVRRERGFSWLGSRLAQHLDATPRFESREVMVSAIVSRTTVVDDVKAPLEHVQRELSVINQRAVGSGYLYLPDLRKVELVSTQSIHDETLQNRSEELAAYAILQLCQAEAEAPRIAAALAGRPAMMEHPDSGPRMFPDDMLNVVEDVFLPRGLGASQFAVAAEMQRVTDWVRETPFASVGSDAGGVCVEVAFGVSHTALIELSSIDQHSWLGAGLTVRTTLPIHETEERLTRFAAALQSRQSQTVDAGGGFGAWAVRPRGEVPHVTWMRFVPNTLFRPGVALDVAIGEINRALWVDRQLHPSLPPRSAWQIMYERDAARGLVPRMPDLPA